VKQSEKNGENDKPVNDIEGDATLPDEQRIKPTQVDFEIDIVSILVTAFRSVNTRVRIA
jgi:hypothetical protein